MRRVCALWFLAVRTVLRNLARWLCLRLTRTALQVVEWCDGHNAKGGAAGYRLGSVFLWLAERALKLSGRLRPAVPENPWL